MLRQAALTIILASSACGTPQPTSPAAQQLQVRAPVDANSSTGQPPQIAGVSGLTCNFLAPNPPASNLSCTATDTEGIELIQIFDVTNPAAPALEANLRAAAPSRPHCGSPWTFLIGPVGAPEVGPPLPHNHGVKIFDCKNHEDAWAISRQGVVRFIKIVQ